ncbi:MAG: SH3 domain-containing protein [Synechococcus sp. ELA057]
MAEPFRRRGSAMGFWPLFRWSALMGFALLAPATLPAGGGERRLPEVRRRESAVEPLLGSACLSLRCAPERQAPVLARVDQGAPLHVLRQWFSPQGQRWLRVESAAPCGRPARGWLNG